MTAHTITLSDDGADRLRALLGAFSHAAVGDELHAVFEQLNALDEMHGYFVVFAARDVRDLQLDVSDRVHVVPEMHEHTPTGTQRVTR
jgi:hypothetical protein